MPLNLISTHSIRHQSPAIVLHSLIPPSLDVLTPLIPTSFSAIVDVPGRGTLRRGSCVVLGGVGAHVDDVSVRVDLVIDVWREFGL